jgi:hypothetical protein
LEIGVRLDFVTADGVFSESALTTVTVKPGEAASLQWSLDIDEAQGSLSRQDFEVADLVDESFEVTSLDVRARVQGSLSGDVWLSANSSKVMMGSKLADFSASAVGER